MHEASLSGPQSTKPGLNQKVIMSGDEYPNTRGSCVGWDISQKTSSLQWEAFPVPAAFLCPNPYASLPPSVHHLLKSSPFLSFGFCLPSLTLWPASHPFSPPLPHTHRHTKPKLPQKEPSPRLCQFNLAVCFRAEECMFVVYSHSERPLGFLLNTLQSWMKTWSGLFVSFTPFGWHQGSLCQASPNINPEMRQIFWPFTGL